MPGRAEPSMKKLARIGDRLPRSGKCAMPSVATKEWIRRRKLQGAEELAAAF
jgi:hypothetical protein